MTIQGPSWRAMGAGPPARRVARVVALVGLVGSAWWITHWGYDSIGLVDDALIVVIAATSLNLVFGYAGQFSLGHSAFFGLGSYATAVGVAKFHWSPGWTLWVGAGLAMVAGMLVALPSRRVRGIYLALVTLSVAYLFPRLMAWDKLAWLTGGAEGYTNVRYGAGRVTPRLPHWWLMGRLWHSVHPGPHDRAVFQFVLTLGVATLGFAMIAGIVRSRLGRALVALRDDETSAAMVGIDVARVKTVVFGISAALCATAGSLATLRSATVSPSSPTIAPLASITFFVAVIIGGAATLWGPVLGGVVYVVGQQWMRSFSSHAPLRWIFGWSAVSPAGMVFSVLLIVVVVVAPDGLAGLVSALGRQLVDLVVERAECPDHHGGVAGGRRRGGPDAAGRVHSCRRRPSRRWGVPWR